MFQLRGDKRLLQPGMKAPFDRDRCTEKRGNGRRMRRNRLFEIPCNLVRLVEKRLNRSLRAENGAGLYARYVCASGVVLAACVRLHIEGMFVHAVTPYREDRSWVEKDGSGEGWLELKGKQLDVNWKSLYSSFPFSLSSSSWKDEGGRNRGRGSVGILHFTSYGQIVFRRCEREKRQSYTANQFSLGIRMESRRIINLNVNRCGCGVTRTVLASYYHQFILSKEIAECRLRQIREMDAKIFK